MKLLIIGIDSLDPRVLFKNIDLFPNIKNLVQTGASASYDAYCYGYGSRDNWSSIYTGLTPKEHGIVNGIYNKTGKLSTLNDIKDKNPFWQLLNKKDISTGLIRLYGVNPPEKIKGYMLGGETNFDFEAEDRDLHSTNPTFCKEDESLKACFKGLLKDPKSTKKPSDFGLDWDEILKNNEVLEDIFTKADYWQEGLDFINEELDFYALNLKNLEEKQPVDTMFFYTAAFDAFQHHQLYDQNKTLILKAMQKIDEFVGKMIKNLNPENIIVMSDHGQSSFKEALPCDDIDIQKEAFGWRDQSVWLKDGSIVTKARSGGFLSGFHDIKGTFIASGKAFKNVTIKEMRTVDIYPTLLEFFDIKIPKNRSGFVLDIFKNKNILNEDKVLSLSSIKRKKIALIQNLDVPSFNKALNEIFLDNRFAEITLFCEEKYEDIFKGNTRVNKTIIMENLQLSKEILNDYDEIYLAYKNPALKNQKYYIKLF